MRYLSAAVSVFVTAAFAIWGVYALARGNEVGASILLVLALVLALISIWPLLSHLGRAAVREDLVAHGGAYEPAVVFPLSRAKQWIVLAISCGFTALIALTFAVAGTIGHRILAGFLIAFALSMVVVSLRSLLRPPPVVALLRHGILTPGWRDPTFVPWEAIEDTKVVKTHGGDSFHLVLREAASTEDAGHGRLTFGRRRRREVALPEDTLIAPETALREAVERYLRDPDARLEIGG